MKQQHLIYVTEVFRTLSAEKKYRVAKLAFYLLLFIIVIVRFVITRLIIHFLLFVHLLLFLCWIYCSTYFVLSNGRFSLLLGIESLLQAHYHSTNLKKN